MYDTIAEPKARFQELNDLFQEKFNCKPQFYVRAPGARESHRRAYRLPRVCCVIGSFPSSYSVLPMAINNDMVIAVAAEDNDKDATEFAIYNTVGFSLGF